MWIVEGSPDWTLGSEVENREGSPATPVEAARRPCSHGVPSGWQQSESAALIDRFDQSTTTARACADSRFDRLVEEVAGENLAIPPDRPATPLEGARRR